MKMCVCEAGWVDVLLEVSKPSISAVLTVKLITVHLLHPTAEVKIVAFQALCQFHYH